MHFLRLLGYTCIFFFLMPNTGYCFKTKTKCQILEDAIQLGPQSMKTYLSKKQHELQYSLRAENNYTTPGKKDRLFWEKRIISHFETMKKRLKTAKNEYKTYVQFASIANATCNFLYYGVRNHSGRDPEPPKKVAFDGYDKINDLSRRCQEVMLGFNKNNYEIQYQKTLNFILDQWITVWDLSGHPMDIKEENNYIVHKEPKPNNISKRSKYTTDGIDYSQRYYQKLWRSMTPEERMEVYKLYEMELEKKRLQAEQERLKTEKDRLKIEEKRLQQEQIRPHRYHGTIDPNGSIELYGW